MMKIDFVRTGGFGGLRLACALDTDSLPGDDASRLRRLVESAGFFELEPPHVAASPSPDRFEYRVSIESQVWGHHTVILPESEVPDELRPLLEQLTSLALKGREKNDDPGGKPPPAS